MNMNNHSQEEKKCEQDGKSYLSNPVQSRCKNCGQFWYSHEPTPNCKNIPLNYAYSKSHSWEETEREMWNEKFPPPMLLGQNQELVADYWLFRIKLHEEKWKAGVEREIEKMWNKKNELIKFIDTSYEMENANGYIQALKDVLSFLTNPLEENHE